MEQNDDPGARNRVLQSLLQYLHAKKEEGFIHGKTWIKYAGRVFDDEEFTFPIPLMSERYATV